VLRTRRKKIPHSWMAAAGDGGFIAEEVNVARADLAFEYMLNRSRLAEPISTAEFAALTGLGIDALEPGLGQAIESGLLERRESVGDVTPTYAPVGDATPTYAPVGDVTPTYEIGQRRPVCDAGGRSGWHPRRGVIRSAPLSANKAYADEAGYLIRTERGARFLNDLQALFLPD